MRLNLACGTDIRDGWVNLDVVERWPMARRACDKIWDARTDAIPCGDGEAVEVYAGYLLMHLVPRWHAGVLKEIRRALHPEGLLMVGEVDMRVVMARWLDDPSDERLCELIWGEQGVVHGVDLADYDKHCHGFTEESLRELLDRNGFTGFARINIHHPDVFWEMTLTCRKK